MWDDAAASEFMFSILNSNIFILKSWICFHCLFVMNSQ